MSKLNLVVTLSEVDSFTREIIAEHEVIIEAEELDEADLLSSVADNLIDFDAAARKQMASRRVDYDSFSSDSAYLEELDKVAADFYTTSVAVGGAVSREYLVEGEYGGNGGLWSDNEFGVNMDEAKFQALWTLQVNSCGGIEKRIKVVSPEKFIEDWVDSLDSNEVHFVELAGVRLEDSLVALSELISETETTNTGGPALAKAKDLLKKHKENMTARLSDAIVYLEDTAQSGPKF